MRLYNELFLVEICYIDQKISHRALCPGMKMYLWLFNHDQSVFRGIEPLHDYREDLACPKPNIDQTNLCFCIGIAQHHFINIRSPRLSHQFFQIKVQ